MPSPVPHPASDRLDGWKEIASYLKRSVRTVQRWEAQLRLPVHRLVTGQTDSVYAIPAELDAWIASAAGRRGAAEEPAPSGGSADGGEPTSGAAATVTPPHRAWVALTVGICLLAVVGVTWMASASRSGRGPDGAAPRAEARRVATLAVDGHALVLLDKDGRETGRHEFPEALDDLANPAKLPRLTAIADLDSDGATEIVVVRESSARHLVSVLNANGSERSHWSSPRTPRFGSAAAAGAGLLANLVYAPDPPDGTFFVAAHVPVEFAAVVAHLDAHGRLLHEYWSNGYVESVRQFAGRSGGRTLVGGIFNETRDASLAVFDGPPAGSAPAGTAEFRCADCPPGAPAEFLVFPRSRVQKRLGCMASASKLAPDGGRGVIVHVQLGDSCTERSSAADHEFASYFFDDNLVLQTAGVGSGFQAVVDNLIGLGRRGLTAADNYRGEADLFPVLRWNRARSDWDRITGPAARPGPARSR